MNPNYTDIFGRLNYNDKRIRTVAHTVNNPPYKVYTALLTQSGGDDLQEWESGGGPLILGYTYQISSNDGGTADFTNVGAPNNNVGTYFVATGTTPNSWGVGDNAGLSGNAGAPVVNVLENTLGATITWTYDAVGEYHGELSSGSFDPVRTITTSNSSFYSSPYYSFLSILSGDNTKVILGTFDTDGSSEVNGEICIEIRVYN